MAEDSDRPPLTEPVILPCLFVSGSAVFTANGAFQIVLWNDVPRLGGEMEERRIAARVALSDRAARELYQQLRKAMGRH